MPLSEVMNCSIPGTQDCCPNRWTSAVGAGTGMITPLGFAALATASPAERLGQTMGAAELGRELGDAGGPLLVAAVAAAATLTAGFAALAALTAAAVLASRVGDERGVRQPSQ